MKFIKKFALLLIPIILYIISILLQLYIDPNHTFQNKLIIIGLVTLIINIIILLIPKDLISNPGLIFSIYAINLFILLVNFLIGPKIAGTKRWIPLGHFTYQPSEMFKPILIIIASLLFSNPHSNYKKSIKLISFLTLPVIFFVFLQPDAGTTIIIITTLILIILRYLYTQNRHILKYLVMFIIFSLSYISIIINKLMAILLLVVAILFKKELTKPYFIIFNILFLLITMSILFYQYIPGLKQYQKQRIKVFTTLLITHPLNNALEQQENISFNLKQARIAIGSGGFTGKGLANITQSRLKFLPEYKTDFMYATLSESFGLFGILTILGLYLILLYIINRYTRSSIIGSYLAFGTSSLLLIELVVNIGGNLGILPTKGIPLPFLGYGGTSLIAHTILISYISHFNKD